MSETGTTPIPDVTARVGAGISFLDTYVPDWRRKVDPFILDIESFQDCILGQVFGYYFDGKAELGLTDTQTEFMGFAWVDTSEIAPLNAAWKEVLA